MLHKDTLNRMAEKLREKARETAIRVDLRVRLEDRYMDDQETALVITGYRTYIQFMHRHFNRSW